MFVERARLISGVVAVSAKLKPRGTLFLSNNDATKSQLTMSFVTVSSTDSSSSEAFSSSSKIASASAPAFAPSRLAVFAYLN
jgi:hypothetical protein